MNKEKKTVLSVMPICVITYLVCYCFRSILSILTPVLNENGIFSLEALALFSSVYMVTYALGQLINGYIGDFVKPKYMTLFGLTLTGIGLALFIFLPSRILGVVCYFLIGFGQSMLRGPLVKAMAENLRPSLARLGCVLITLVSYLGPTIVGIVLAVLNYRLLYIFAGALSCLFGVICFTVFSLLERKNIIKPINKQETRRQKLDVFGVFKLNRFPMYFCIGLIIGITDVSINYWMTTYFRESLLLSQEKATAIYSGIYLFCAACPFLTLGAYKLFKGKDIWMLRTFFSVAAILMLMTLFIKSTVFCILGFALAIVCAAICSGTLWSIFVPSLAKSGKVSSANGVLDCSCYFSASLVNLLVVPIKNAFGWNGVTVFWSIIIMLGFLFTVVFNTRKTEEET